MGAKFIYIKKQSCISWDSAGAENITYASCASGTMICLQSVTSCHLAKWPYEWAGLRISQVQLAKRKLSLNSEPIHPPLFTLIDSS